MYSVTIKDGTTERTFTAPTAEEALRMAGISPAPVFPPNTPISPNWSGPRKPGSRWWEVQCGGAIVGGAVTTTSNVGFAI